MFFIETGLPVCSMVKVKCKSCSKFERYSKTSLLKAETKHNVYLPNHSFPHHTLKILSYLTTLTQNLLIKINENPHFSWLPRDAYKGDAKINAPIF